MLINNVPLNGVKLLKCMDVLQYQQLTLKVLRAINIDFLLTISILILGIIVEGLRKLMRLIN